MTRSKPGCPHNRRKKYPKNISVLPVLLFYILNFGFWQRINAYSFSKQTHPSAFPDKSALLSTSLLLQLSCRSSIVVLSRGAGEIRHREREREKVRKRAGMCVCVLISNYFMYMFAHSPVWHVWLLKKRETSLILKTSWQKPIKHLCPGVCNSMIEACPQYWDLYDSK